MGCPVQFVFRLSRYQAWVAKQKEELEAVIADCRADLEEARQRLNKREQAYDALWRRAMQDRESGVTAGEFTMQQSLLDRARKRIDEEKEVVLRINERLAELLAQWRDVYKRHEILDKLYARQYEAYRLEVQRRAQRLYDEWSTLKGGESHED